MRAALRFVRGVVTTSAKSRRINERAEAALRADLARLRKEARSWVRVLARLEKAAAKRKGRH
jgi:hypothetical protein